MPTLIERAREGFANIILGDERRKLQESMRVMAEAFFTGPFQLPPEQLIAQLKEIDSSVLEDLVNQLLWEQIGTYSANLTAERQRAVAESRRLWKYSPLAQWAVQLWTNYGMGESLTVTCIDETADEDWQEFWKADRNSALLADDKIHDLSNKLLVTGERFLVDFVSTADGESTLRKIAPEEIVEVITHPDDKSKPLFYKREWTDTKNTNQKLYYPDWTAFFERPKGNEEGANILDSDFRDGKTLAEYVLPNGANRSDKANALNPNQLGGEDKPATVAVIFHIAHNQKDEDDLRGWPILATPAPYIRAHRQHVENRLAVSAAKAMYVREFTTESGSRGVAALKSKLNSRLGTSTYVDTNPQAAPGSNLIHNKAVEHKDLPVSTGASDAKADNEMFAWFALIGMGLFPTSAGLDTSRWATALAMDKTQSMQWTEYQTFWACQFKTLVKIVLKFKELYGGIHYQSYDANVSTDQFSLVDFPPIVESISTLLSNTTPLVDNGVIPQTAARAILARLWRIVLQALGIADAAKLTDDKAFEIEQMPEAVTKAIEAAAQNYRDGKVSADEVAGYLLTELIEGKNVKVNHL